MLPVDAPHTSTQGVTLNGPWYRRGSFETLLSLPGEEEQGKRKGRESYASRDIGTIVTAICFRFTWAFQSRRRVTSCCYRGGGVGVGGGNTVVVGSPLTPLNKKRRRLESVPINGRAQYHLRLAPRLAVLLELGLGHTTCEGKTSRN